MPIDQNFVYQAKTQNEGELENLLEEVLEDFELQLKPKGFSTTITGIPSAADSKHIPDKPPEIRISELNNNLLTPAIILNDSGQFSPNLLCNVSPEIVG